MNEHGKSIVNFQITLILIAVLSVPGIFLFGLGILGLIFVGNRWFCYSNYQCD